MGLSLTTKRRSLVRNIVLIFLAMHAGPRVAIKSPKLPINATIAFAETLPRKNYRYSVVPGGVYSAEELAAARRNDKVVAGHYADFGSATAVTKLTADMLVYVSYRKGDKVYWTKKKHRVCSGEPVITDGKNMARTRCGNRLSKVFKLPVDNGYEPPENALGTVDKPPFEIAAVSGGPDFYNPGLPGPQGFTPRETAPIGPAVSGADSGTGPARTGASNLFESPGSVLPPLAPVIGPAYLGSLASNSVGPGTTSGSGTGTAGGTGTATGPAGTATTLIPEVSSFLLMFGGISMLALCRRFGTERFKPPAGTR